MSDFPEKSDICLNDTNTYEPLFASACVVAQSGRKCGAGCGQCSLSMRQHIPCGEHRRRHTNNCGRHDRDGDT
jgi:hypothetical protein